MSKVALHETNNREIQRLFKISAFVEGIAFDDDKASMLVVVQWCGSQAPS